MTKPYYPHRTRGVYRAAANKKSPIHAWADKLIKAKGSFAGLLAWYLRNKGDFSMEKMLTDPRPSVFDSIPKDTGWGGTTLIVPFKK